MDKTKKQKLLQNANHWGVWYSYVVRLSTKVLQKTYKEINILNKIKVKRSVKSDPKKNILNAFSL